jgi:hypothetical protein
MKFNCAHTDLVELHKLIPNPKNPNIHSPEQVDRLAKIIDFQGQRLPIVVSNHSGFITKGHCRLMAIQKLGWEKAAVDYQDYESEAQEYADIVADNSIAEWATLDLESIKFNLPEFDNLDLDLLGIKDLSFISTSIEIEEFEDVSEIKEEKYIMEVQFPNEMELQDIYDDLISRGYICKIKGNSK